MDADFDHTAELTGELSPPLANGELIFDAPWQGRVFGMARSLCLTGMYSWDDFRARLIHSIRTWEAGNAGDVEDAEYPYYDLFLEAFEKLLSDLELLEDSELSTQIQKLITRPHDHDH